MAIFVGTADPALELVPTLKRLHAAGDRAKVVQIPVASWAAERGSRRWVVGNDGRALTRKGLGHRLASVVGVHLLDGEGRGGVRVGEELAENDDVRDNKTQFDAVLGMCDAHATKRIGLPKDNRRGVRNHFGTELRRQLISADEERTSVGCRTVRRKEARELCVDL